MPQQIISSHASTLCSGPDDAGYEVVFPSTIGEGDDEVSMELAMWLCTIDPLSFQIAGQPDAPAPPAPDVTGAPASNDGVQEADSTDDALDAVEASTGDETPGAEVDEAPGETEGTQDDDPEAAGRVANVIAQSAGQSIEDMLAAAEAALVGASGGTPVDSAPAAPRGRGATKHVAK